MNALDAVYFYGFAVLSVVGAAGVVAARNPIRGAMGLLLLILGIAALFLQLHAEFLAAIQLIVYAGAIVVLFLFVIMLLGPSASTPDDGRGFALRAFSGSLFGLAGAVAIVAIARAALPGSRTAALPEPDASFGGIDAFGSVLFSDALVPFELSSALLMVAVIGAIAVAKGRQGVRTLSRAEQSIAAVPMTAPSIGDGAPETGVFSHEIHATGPTEGSS